MSAKVVISPKILMSSGSYFSLLEPETSNFDIYVIAHALARICRFTGHTREFYSVAQHSVAVSNIVAPEFKLQALLHDAAEAFLGDVSSPLKSLLPDYKALESRVEAAVFARFGLPAKLHAEVKRADLIMLVTEARDLLPEHKNADWAQSIGVAALDQLVQCWDSDTAESEFLNLYFDLIASSATA